jgi:hypothetical protein
MTWGDKTPGQSGFAAAVELAGQFPHAGLHLLPAGVQVELDSGLDEVLLAHPQVVRAAGDQPVALGGDFDRDLPGRRLHRRHVRIPCLGGTLSSWYLKQLKYLEVPTASLTRDRLRAAATLRIVSGSGSAQPEALTFHPGTGNGDPLRPRRSQRQQLRLRCMLRPPRRLPGDLHLNHQNPAGTAHLLTREAGKGYKTEKSPHRDKEIVAT